MAYGWGINEPVIKPLEEGGDNINQYAQKIKDALDTLYVELRQDIVRATLAESIAATDINKIITPSTAYRTYYGTSEPSNLQGKNNDTYIKYGDVKEMYIKVSGSWQKIDAVPQPATQAEVSARTLNTKYVTPLTLYQNNKDDTAGGFPRLDSSGLLPRKYIPTRMAIFDTPGTHSWTCPAGVTKVLISGCAGGAGGASGYYNAGNCTTSGGGASAYVDCAIVNVTASITYTVTIGAGGTGGAATTSYLANNGNNGGTTSFGTLLSISGGNTTTSYGSVAGVGSSVPAGVFGTGGASGATRTEAVSGKGGNSALGVGGAERSTNGNGNDGSGYGSAGAGGRGSGYKGGSGAPGLLILKWMN